MKTIKNDIICEYVIKKSRFISFLIFINDENEAKEKIADIKDKYKDATHVCFGYICDNVTRYSDDGEPSGTAGMPIINVLINNNLNHILGVVVRYFGGIKLGAGGLVRAYTSSVTEALSKTDICDLSCGYSVKIVFTHDKIKYVDNILKKYNVEVSKVYDNNITYKFLINTDNYLLLKNELDNNISLEIEKNALIK